MQALGITKDGSGSLGLVVGDSSRTQWTCGGMELNDSTLQFTFDVAPSETVPVIKVLGHLTFSGTPTIDISVDPDDLTAGGVYPLCMVVGDAPSTVPTLASGVTGALQWGGTGGNTLFWNTGVAPGTLIFIK